ncbi:Armadillo-like helical [Phaffia rhodozyma]|uniref:Armadillo-like helical n=1 Tax=Phaffia rhodozyma TaxID=264483 RepID=A0A0F7SUC6_PHARH|nr:Armadillo-like helical [Phaffia rhodozyma]
MMDRPTKESHMDGDETLGSPLLMRRTITNVENNLIAQPIESPETTTTTPTPGFLPPPLTQGNYNESLSGNHSSSTNSSSDPLGLFVKRPVPLRQSGCPPVSYQPVSCGDPNIACDPYKLTRTPSLSSSSSYGVDVSSPTCLSDGLSSSDGLYSPESVSPIAIQQNLNQSAIFGPAPSQMSLLSQILLSHSHQSKPLSYRTPNNSNPTTAHHSLQSTPLSSNTSSPAGYGNIRQLKGRRMSNGACDILDQVGEEDGEAVDCPSNILDLHPSDVRGGPEKEESSLGLVPSDYPSPAPVHIRFGEAAVLPKRPPLPLSDFAPPVTILASLAKTQSTDATVSKKPTLKFADSGSTTPLSMPSAQHSTAHSETSSRSSPAPVPPEVTCVPVKKPQLTFAVATTSARPAMLAKESKELMKSLQDSGDEDDDPDEEGDEDEDEDEDEEDDEDDDDDDDDDEEDIEDDEEDEDEDGKEEEDEVEQVDGFDVEGDGYEEDDEGEGLQDDEGISAPIGRKYRFKRESLFGQSDSEDDELLEDEQVGTLRSSRPTGGFPPDSYRQIDQSRDQQSGTPKLQQGWVETTLKKRRSSLLTLHPNNASELAFSVSRAESSIPSSHRGDSTCQQFQTPVLSFITTGRNRRSAYSPRRGGFKGGYSPGLKKRNTSVASSPRTRVDRDDFLPSHLKSEKGKEKERMAERKGREVATSSRSGTEGGSGTAGRCSRHRSPPPSGRECRKSGGERREGSRSQTSKAPQRAQTSELAITRPAALPLPPSPILRNPYEFTNPVAPKQVNIYGIRSTSYSVPRRAPDGHLTPPIFLTDTENWMDIQAISHNRPGRLSERQTSLSAVSSAFRQCTSTCESDDPSAAKRRNSYSLKVDVTQAVRQAKSDVWSDGAVSDHPSDVAGALTQALQQKLAQQPLSPVSRPFAPPSTSFLKRHTSLLGTIAIAQPQQRLQPVPCIIPELSSPETLLPSTNQPLHGTTNHKALKTTIVHSKTANTTPINLDPSLSLPLQKRSVSQPPLVKSKPIPCPAAKVPGDWDGLAHDF